MPGSGMMDAGGGGGGGMDGGRQGGSLSPFIGHQSSSSHLRLPLPPAMNGPFPSSFQALDWDDPSGGGGGGGGGSGAGGGGGGPGEDD